MIQTYFEFLAKLTFMFKLAFSRKFDSYFSGLIEKLSPIAFRILLINELFYTVNVFLSYFSSEFRCLGRFPFTASKTSSRPTPEEERRLTDARSITVADSGGNFGVKTSNLQVTSLKEEVTEIYPLFDMFLKR